MLSHAKIEEVVGNVMRSAGMDPGDSTLRTLMVACVMRDEIAPQLDEDALGSDVAGILCRGGLISEEAMDNCCSCCGSPLDDGEGYDGLCGNCADRAENEKAER